MMGSDHEVDYEQTDEGLHLMLPARRPTQLAAGCEISGAVPSTAATYPEPPSHETSTLSTISK